MNVLVDTSVWSLALRRDDHPPGPEAEALRRLLAGGGSVFTTGLILQELLQGFRGPRQWKAILEAFAALPLVVPDRDDHIEAASLRNECRRHGLQVGTIDALLARICLRHGLEIFTTDRDFAGIARHAPLRIFGAS
jgi:predicted nucleic acid-binding protein